ncbi:CBS domain-containing protein [Salisediminibacterium selenitireducens]|uniref:CBS domain containing membrane protein n=1 Tax=Bacillus selenitireducens (strain ATCC 700615 / DSM 15326 / MLS10) TaxID=439292 RepID=D6XYS7_BACIE|nr:CBS domain-containing protein [Salisediminibacterium selenitireducens]ADH98235.1 CBS domain containing membrane protein [[Bacillus] selenitireducens MLS10]
MASVKDVMTKEAVTIKPDTSVEDTAKLLLQHHFSGVPVVDDEGVLQGVVSEGDIIKRASHIQSPAVLEFLGGLIYLDSPKKYMEELKQAMSLTIGDLMKTEVITAHPDDSIEQIATKMLSKNIKRFPVVDEEGKVIGIISRRDIMKHLYQAEDL